MRAALTQACPDCAALERRIAAYEARLLALEQARGPRDAEDRAAMQAIAAAADGRPFTAAAIWDRASADESVVAALRAADVESASELATWLRGMRNSTVGGLRLVRLQRRTAAGYRWAITVVPDV
jgi:hypothetical protein